MLLTDLAEVTPHQLEDLGVSVPTALGEATIPLWRRSAGAKWHWADSRARCKHLPGCNSWDTKPTNIQPDERIPALGFSVPTTSLCSGCQRQIALSGPAEAFVTVAAELVRGRNWLASGRAAASEKTHSWLQFARWKNAQPSAAWDEAVRQVRGKSWAASALALRGVIVEYNRDAETVTQQYINSIGDNAARASQIERARRMVETDSPAMAESKTLLQIAGCHAPNRGVDALWTAKPEHPYTQPDPWGVVASLWKAVQLDPASRMPLERLCDFLDEQFPHVHDLAALGACSEDTPPYEPGDCLHSWAQRSAQAHRRGIVTEWLSRLDLALDGIASTNPHASFECTHLVCIPFWPLIHDGMASVAYLAQFPIAAGPFTSVEGYFHAPAVVVLRVPDWAAQHAEQLQHPLRTAVIDDDPHQAIAMVRAEGVPIVDGEFTARRKPSRMILDARSEIDQPTSHLGYSHYRYQNRPLAQGASLATDHNGAERDWKPWLVHSVLQRGALFVYGADDLELLHLAFSRGRWQPDVTLSVELQTSCRRHLGDGPHVCDVDGHLIFVRGDGSVTFQAKGFRESVEVPAPYIAGLSFR